METPELRPEFRLREPLPDFPIKTSHATFEVDPDYPNYLINAPSQPDFVFGHGSSQYKRCGNIIMSQKGKGLLGIITRINGTLYVRDDGAWVLIHKTGTLQASGSAGSFPLQKTENNIIDTRTTEPYRSKSRFDDIIVCGD